MLEKQIETKLIALVKKLNGWCLKFWCLSFTGMPDRIVLLPGGRIYFVELKKPKTGVLRPRQTVVIPQLRSLGFKVFVIWTVDELNTFENLLTTRFI